jgi:hypothetical protein
MKVEGKDKIEVKVKFEIEVEVKIKGEWVENIIIWEKRR